MINLEIKSNIDTLKTEIDHIWDKEKNTIFDPSKNQKLVQLIKILNDSQTRDNKDKTIANFLKVSDELYSILQISKLESSLNSLINYLKYFSNINNFQENLNLINSSEWFDNLFSEVASYNINAELLVAFIAMIESTKDSFLKKLNETVHNFYNNIKTNKTLDTAEVNDIFKLREFLTRIKTANIKNLEDIKTNLKSNLINLSLNLSIDKNITNLQNLINPVNEEDAKSLWEYIAGSITEIIKDEDINIVIYNKLLTSKILPQQEIETYNKLETLLKDAYDNMSKKHKEEQFFKRQLAEIYCQKAKISTITPNQSIELYKKAAELGSVKANIELGTIELGRKNYSEALKYLHLTPDVTGILKAFESLINTHKSEIISKIQHGGIEDITKLSLVLTEAYLEQAKYFKSKRG
ncbi:hypothetical protein [Rickettsia hoogstraalii]|uniref:hypothetical protein n=1 Tax=Rickettsia hoogstraalii TaxID=467174 RepID=UPI000AF0ABCE|nr:hypothetical protein [Rickettsia hoogstraalii]